MRCATVKLSVLQREKNWTPEHYLGSDNDDREVEQARHRAERAAELHEEAKQRRRDNIARVRKFVDDGDMVPFTESADEST